MRSNALRHVVILTAVLLIALGLRGDLPRRSNRKPSPDVYPNLHATLTAANKAYLSSDVDRALGLYLRGLENTPDTIAYYRALFLTGIGNCHVLLWQNMEAIRAFVQAIEIAERNEFDDILLKASVGRLSVYRRIPGLEAARLALREAEPVLLRSRDPMVIAQVANVFRDIDFARALYLYRVAIQEAYLRSDNADLSILWNQLGHALLLRGDLDAAEPALTEAFRLRRVSGRRNLQPWYFYLGWLRRLQGRYEEATNLLLRARELSTEPGAIYPYSVERELARNAAAAGDENSALAYYDRAVHLAAESRLNTLPAEAFRTAVEGGLHGLFAEYIDLGMRVYERNRDPRISARMFSLAEASRSSLFLSALSDQPRLPNAYVSKVSEYRKLLAAALSASDPTVNQQLGSLRLELAHLEMELGIRSEKNSPQIFEREGTGIPLKGVQTKLRSSEALLSFLAGPAGSFVWAVTSDSFEVHRLPDRSTISEQVSNYRKSLESNGPETERQGQVLVGSLLSGLSERVRSRKDWILSLDDPLYDVPFAALPDPSDRSARLCDRYSLRLTPAAAGATSPARRVSKEFAGIADPVYNLADSRNGGSTRSSDAVQAALELPRLPGTARELKRCAAAWAQDPSPELVTGVAASREALMRAVEKSPAVLHVGVHVLRHPLAPDELMMVLGRRVDGEYDFLTPSEIARWQQPLGLITLSGCSSGTGQARPGLGLFGLTRAWLAAGASSVLASYWPIRDDDGQLLATMYSELGKAGGQVHPLAVARALQHAQSQARKRAGWQAHPSYWAAFFVAGKE